MPTSRRTTPKRGFSLLEILLVLALLGLVTVNIIPDITAIFRTGVRSSVERFAAMLRYTYDQSILTGQVHRIVLNLSEQSWHVEKAPPGTLPSEKLKEELLPGRMSADDLPQENSDDFFRPLKGKIDTNLPKGVQIVGAYSWRLGENAPFQEEGQFYIYSFPNGFIDQVQVVLAEEASKEEKRFKISVDSLTAQIDVETETGR